MDGSLTGPALRMPLPEGRIRAYQTVLRFDAILICVIRTFELRMAANAFGSPVPVSYSMAYRSACAL